MKSPHTCSILVALLLVGSRVNAACQRVRSDGDAASQEFKCHGGSIADIGNDVPANAEVISIYRMPVIYIDASLFSRYVRLRELPCYHCNITDIADGAFSGLRDLDTLYLVNTHLTRVKASWFRGDLDSLQTIVFVGSMIEHIDDNAFDGLKSLTYLGIMDSKLKKVSAGWFGIGASHHLGTLKLYRNEISDIDDNAFSGLTELEDLELGNNRLTSVRVEWFGEPVRVKNLRVGFNEIVDIDPELFRRGRDLEILVIAGNLLTCQSIETLVQGMGKRSSKMLNIKVNPWPQVFPSRPNYSPECIKNLRKLSNNNNILITHFIT